MSEDTNGDDVPTEPVEEPEPTNRRRGGLRESWDWPGWD